MRVPPVTPPRVSGFNPSLGVRFWVSRDIIVKSWLPGHFARRRLPTGYCTAKGCSWPNCLISGRSSATL